MAMNTLCFVVETIADCAATDILLASGGNSFEKVAAAYRDAVRVLGVGVAAAASTLTSRFHCPPTSARSGPGPSLQVLVSSEDAASADRMRRQLERGELARWYRLAEKAAPPIAWERFQGACRLVRRSDSARAQTTPGSDPGIPREYWWVESLDPDPDFDWLILDHLTREATFEFVLDVAVQWHPMAQPREDYNRYMANLDALRSPWRDMDEAQIPPRYQAPETGIYVQGPPVSRHRNTDPAVESVFRAVQRFRESLDKTHLSFDFRVLAETPGMAWFIAANVGGAAFRGTSFDIFEAGAGTSALENIRTAARMGTVTESGAAARPDLFGRLEVLRTVAPLEELESLLRLPIARDTPTRIFRRHTDGAVPGDGPVLIIGEEIQ